MHRPPTVGEFPVAKAFPSLCSLSLSPLQHLAMALISILTVAAVVDRSSPRFCFPKDQRHVRPVSSLIKLEIMSWGSHEHITRFTEILLREKLGYDVRVLHFEDDSSTDLAYRRVANGDVSFNMELWPRSALTSDPAIEFVGGLDYATDPDRTWSSHKHGYFDLGMLGYVGRSGWFVPVRALRNLVPARSSFWQWSKLGSLASIGAFDVLSAESGSGGSGSGGADPMLLMTSNQLPTTALTTGPCADGGTLSWYGGTLDCSRGAWAPSATTHACCPRSMKSASGCFGRPPCIALMADSPLTDMGQNEAKVLASSLPLEIVYGDVAAATLDAEVRVRASNHSQPPTRRSVLHTRANRSAGSRCSSIGGSRTGCSKSPIAFCASTCAGSCTVSAAAKAQCGNRTHLTIWRTTTRRPPAILSSRTFIRCHLGVAPCA